MLVTTRNQGISLNFNTNYIDLNFGPYIEERKRYPKGKRTAVPQDQRPEHGRPHEDDQGIDESEIEVRPPLMRYYLFFFKLKGPHALCSSCFPLPLFRRVPRLLITWPSSSWYVSFTPLNMDHPFNSTGTSLFASQGFLVFWAWGITHLWRIFVDFCEVFTFGI